MQTDTTKQIRVRLETQLGVKDVEPSLVSHVKSFLQTHSRYVVHSVQGRYAGNAVFIVTEIGVQHVIGERLDQRRPSEALRRALREAGLKPATGPAVGVGQFDPEVSFRAVTSRA